MAARGVTLAGPYAALPELARQVEARGFDAAWVLETTASATIQAAVVAQATSRIDVGTNVMLAFPRSPVVTAMDAWDLNELTGDRFVVGLGSQIRQWIEQRYSAAFDRPAERMAEYVQAMQAAWRMERGEDVTFDGEIYRVLRPGVGGRGRGRGRRLPRVHVAAVGPLMTKAAATYADGILGHPFTSDRYLANDVLPRVEAALSVAGRSRNDFTVGQGVITCVADDRDVAIREAKAQIACYGVLPTYRAVFASYGDEALADSLPEVFKHHGNDLDAIVAAIPDEAVERYAVAGTPDEVRDKLGAIEKLADQVILGGPWFRVSRERVIENLWAIIETFGDRRRGS